LLTSLNLPPGALKRLREIAGRLLRESEGYRALLDDLSTEDQPAIVEKKT
jgi:hypothetical protein